MALTVESATGKQSMGSRRFEIVDITPDSSWLAAGEALTPAELGFASIDFILFESVGGYVFKYDRTNQKVLAYYGDYDPAAAGPLTAVPDTTDIDAVTVRALVIGTV